MVKNKSNSNAINKCYRKMARKYRKDVKAIKKHFPDGIEREELLLNLEEQYFANKLALDHLVNLRKEKESFVSTEKVSA